MVNLWVSGVLGTQHLQPLTVGLTLRVVHVTEQSRCPETEQESHGYTLAAGRQAQQGQVLSPLYPCRVHGAEGCLTLVLWKTDKRVTWGKMATKGCSKGPGEELEDRGGAN